MVTFDEKLHPKHGLRLRFKYEPRAFQYLAFFKITATTDYKTYKFVPLDITFESWDELCKFLSARGIVYDEYDIRYTDTVIEAKAIVIDTTKIYDVEENVSKYLLNLKYYSINEVAKMLSFSRPTVYKLVNQNALKAVRIYGQLRINHLDLMEYINKENSLHAQIKS